MPCNNDKRSGAKQMTRNFQMPGRSPAYAAGGMAALLRY